MSTLCFCNSIVQSCLRSMNIRMKLIGAPATVRTHPGKGPPNFPKSQWESTSCNTLSAFWPEKISWSLKLIPGVTTNCLNSGPGYAQSRICCLLGTHSTPSRNALHAALGRVRSAAVHGLWRANSRIQNHARSLCNHGFVPEMKGSKVRVKFV